MVQFIAQLTAPYNGQLENMDWTLDWTLDWTELDWTQHILNF